jgi:hypothetical protein
MRQEILQKNYKISPKFRATKFCKHPNIESLTAIPNPKPDTRIPLLVSKTQFMPFHQTEKYSMHA